MNGPHERPTSWDRLAATSAYAKDSYDIVLDCEDEST
jgi:hypothetical protein